MKVIVTRPQREARKLVQSLCAIGFDAVALPLISVSGPADPSAVTKVWSRLQEFDAVMFVSGNAVEQFFALRPPSTNAFREQDPSVVRAFVTGPGSQSALRKEGVPAQRIDAPDSESEQFDSEALWRVVQQQVVPGFRVLIVRGAEGDDTPAGAGRDWFAAKVQEAGGHVDYVVSYQRNLPHWTEQEVELAAQAGSGAGIWLFSSSQAIFNLATLCPAQSWSQARAIVTHSRIGKAARDLGFGVVLESRPSTPALVASIESLQ